MAGHPATSRVQRRTYPPRAARVAAIGDSSTGVNVAEMMWRPRLVTLPATLVAIAAACAIPVGLALTVALTSLAV
ncbi:MAG TPA: hypothetical protein VJ820_13835 [Propionibacteriaceae bacterium]|nr:hypothetical protein [Propionibacteriaceae bacterium]